MFEGIKALFSGDWNTYHEKGIIPNIWAGITGQKSNEMVNNENLQFQKENLDYQKALQQQIFEREDTSYQRTVEDMRAAGLNPLSMQGTNGAGEAIATTAPQKQLLPQQNAQMISSLMSLATSINDVASGTYTRDSLALENDRKFLENMEKAHELGIDYDSIIGHGSKNKIGSYLGDLKRGYKQSPINKSTGKPLFDSQLWNQSAYSGLMSQYSINREIAHKKQKGYFDSDSPLERGINSIEELLSNPDTADRIKNLGVSARELLFGLLGF